MRLRSPIASSVVAKVRAASRIASAPDEAAMARSDSQSWRGATRRRSVSAQFIIARAVVPIFSESCGRTRMTTGAALLFIEVVWRSSAQQQVGDAVVQRVVGGVDHVGGNAHGRPARILPVCAFDDHAGAGLGARLRIEDTHLV